MKSACPHICVSICTYCRPKLLERLLSSLDAQETHNRYTFSIVVADNDSEKSAQGVVSSFAAHSAVPAGYCVEPRKSIAHARNTALAHAAGGYVAFIDDDELAPPDWLFLLLETCSRHGASGVFGPVRPHFDMAPPQWFLRGRFCDRPEHSTGYVMPWRECRTGNVLLKRDAIQGMNPVFTPAFGAGASDIDLFRRLIEIGHTFVWCNEAFVSEVVSPNRWTRRFLVRRAMLRGRISLLHPGNQTFSIAKSLLAIPAYTIALPFFQIVGHHRFMEYLVKLCDHLGKILALIHLNPVRERDM